MSSKIDYIGEVIESSSTHVVAQIPHNREISPPPFGSFVRMDKKLNIFGVVYNMITTSVDPSRQPIAYGIPVDELSNKMPHLFELQRTNFEIALIGFGQDKICHYTPPLPPRIHSRVYACSDKEISRITENFAFLRMLLANTTIPTEELVAATIRTAGTEENFIVKAGKELSRLLADDYGRLKAILQRLS